MSDKLSGWLNVYDRPEVHQRRWATREEADKAAEKTGWARRIACIDLSQFHTGDGL